MQRDQLLKDSELKKIVKYFISHHRQDIRFLKVHLWSRADIFFSLPFVLGASTQVEPDDVVGGRLFYLANVLIILITSSEARR